MEKLEDKYQDFMEGLIMSADIEVEEEVQWYLRESRMGTALLFELLDNFNSRDREIINALRFPFHDFTDFMDKYPGKKVTTEIVKEYINEIHKVVDI